MITYQTDNLKTHGVTVTEVDEALNHPLTIWLDIGTSRDGNDRLMFIGLTKTGRILEIGIELVDDNEHVFHAMNAGKKYLEEFNNAQLRDG